MPPGILQIHGARVCCLVFCAVASRLAHARVYPALSACSEGLFYAARPARTKPAESIFLTLLRRV